MKIITAILAYNRNTFPIRDLGLSQAYKLDSRPELRDVSKAFKSARLAAFIGAPLLTVVLVIVWPAAMVAVGVMDLSGFRHWVSCEVRYLK